MSNQKIIDNYAEALLVFKVNPKDVLSVLDILHTYEDYLISPLVSRQMKMKIINLLNLHHDPFVIQLCKIILQRDKPILLCPVLEHYIYLCNSLDKVKAVTVTTTLPLDALSSEVIPRHFLVNNFKLLLGAKKILLTNTVDARLLGGILVETETNVVTISAKDRMKGFGYGL